MPHLRVLLVALVLLAGPLAVPGAGAEPTLTDAEGDVEASAGVGGVGTPGAPHASEQADSADLVALELAETEDAFLVRVQVKSLEGVTAGAEYAVDFRWQERQYRVVAGYFILDAPVGGSFSFASLRVLEGDRYDLVAELTPEVERGEGALSVEVPKAYVLDGFGRAPGRGDSITDLVVTSDRTLDPTFFVGTRLSLRDRMPDEGGGLFTFQKGDYSQGDLLLTSPQRVRVSNGGSTTFVYQAVLRNLGEQEDEIALAVLDAPEEWDLTFQTPVRVPPQEEKTVAVLVSVPFGHEHGGFQSFNLTAQSTRDPQTQARMRLGVLHTPVPQPTGHHSELWLHAHDPRSGPVGEAFSTAFPWARGWMNTISDHEGDAEAMLPNNRDDGRLEWWIFLDPALQIGLDFDLEGVGKLTGAVLAGTGEASLVANLYYFRDAGSQAEQVLLAQGTKVDLALDPQKTTPFEITLTPTPESDYIAYEGPADLALVVSMEGGTGGLWLNHAGYPRLTTADFLLDLPLNEYHDRLTGVAEAASAITITPEGAVERAGRPGTILTYAFNVTNSGGAPDAFVLDTAGTDAFQAMLVPAGVVNLDAGETRRVTLAVEIPVDANEGESLEVLLFVHARDDPSKMAVARTKTTATRGAEANPDETDVLLKAQAENQQTPGPGGALALVAVAGAALVLAQARRRA